MPTKKHCNRLQLIDALNRYKQELEPSAQVASSELKQAAVLIPIIDYNDHLMLLFTLRTLHLNHHPGQICFPGGSRDEQDDNLEAALFREVKEEIGLAFEQIQLLAQLPSRSTHSSQYLVTPYVGLIQAPLSLTLDPFEVAEHFEIPLAYFLDLNNFHYNGLYHEITYQHHRIWGATARIVLDLAEILHKE